MNLKTLFGPICILILALVNSPAVAAPLDKSANGKIDEAINVHYLSTNFDKAEGVLLGTLKACGDRCSNGVKARAWMYVGIVRGAGKQDMDGAAAAFMEALSIDPSIELDQDLSTPELKQLFDESGGAVATDDGGDSDVSLDTGSGADVATGGGMECTPDVAEVETRRPVPVACKTSDPAARMVLYFREFGAQKWTQKNMGKGGEYWQATVPCGATSIQGTLAWYVVASDAQGQPVDSYGSEAAPNEITLVASSGMEPPAYPNQKPPARCVDLAECPEDMRGTPACPDSGGGDLSSGGGGWGDSCQDNSECSEGLACMDGTCESAPSCDSDADCSGGECVEFVCHYGDDADDSFEEGPRTLIGIQVGLDLAQLSGTAVCNSNPPVSSPFECYLGDQPYAAPSLRYAGNFFVEPLTQTSTPSTYHHPQGALVREDTGDVVLDAAGNPIPSYTPAQSGTIGSTLAPSTIRVMLTFERLLTAKIGVEGRAGAALGGSPSSGLVDLLHLALRGKYWFSGTGPGLRLFGLLGAGLGRVDAKKEVTVQEFWHDNSPTYNAYCRDPNPNVPLVGQPACYVPVTAYKQMGPMFVTGGIGAFLNLGGHGPSLELNARIMLPDSGFVVQPTGGWLVGF